MTKVVEVEKYFKTLNNRPGGDNAVKNGCTCSVKDNVYGNGYRTDNQGRAVYWVNDNCPLHGKNKK